MRTRKIIPLRFNEAQMRLYEMQTWFRKNTLPVRIIICKARRAGLSTGVESLIYDDTTQHPNTYSLIVANERNPSENVLNMCRRFWLNTPERVTLGMQELALRPPLPPAYRNNPPKDRLEFLFPNGESSYMFVATSKSLDAYLSFGFQNIHATEASRYADGYELFRALSPTLSDEPHSANYVESTPNGQSGRGQWFYEQVMDAAARKRVGYGEYRLLFIPWHEMKMSFSRPFKSPEARSSFEKSLSPVERDIIKKWNTSLEQLLWRRMMLASPTFNRDEDLFDQEYPSDLATAFLTSGVSVFGRRHIKRMMNNARAPIWEGDVYWGDPNVDSAKRVAHDDVRKPVFLSKGESRARGYASNVQEGTRNNLRVFRWPREGERLFIACDVGGGNPDTRDGDYSTICVGVLNAWERDELIATWKGHLNPLAFAELQSALAWGLRYRVGESVAAPVLAPEWQGPGVPCCTYIDTKNLYPNVFRYRQPGVHKMPASKHIGWESNAKTKPLMVETTRRMIERDLIDVPDEELIREMGSYKQTGSFGDPSEFGGAAGRHDDLVSAFEILCCLLRLEAGRTPNMDDPSQVVIDEADNDVPWSRWDEDDEVMPGVQLRDLDDESIDESWSWTIS